MKNDVKKVLLTCVMFIGVMSLSAQLSQHGLVLNGGIGGLDSYEYDRNGKESTLRYEYKYGASVGYRLRFKMPTPKSFHYDVDLNIGTKALKATYNYSSVYNVEGESGINYFKNHTDCSQSYYTSLGGMANYSFIKNLSVGLGVEPTCYFNSKVKFDIPAVAKIAYDFKVIEIGLYGKYGWTNEKVNAEYGKIRDLQLTIFIPFKSK